jgi:hypothetical protein
MPTCFLCKGRAAVVWGGSGERDFKITNVTRQEEGKPMLKIAGRHKTYIYAFSKRALKNDKRE